MVEPTFEIVRQRFRGAVAARRVLVQTLQANRFEIAIDSRLQRGRAARFFLQHLAHRIHRCAAREGRLACEQFVEHGAEPIDIHSGRELLRFTARLLRRHVAGCAEDRHRTRQRAVFFNQTRQAKVRQVRLVLDVEKDIRRLDVTVKNASLMRVMYGAGQLGDQLRRFAI